MRLFGNSISNQYGLFTFTGPTTNLNPVTVTASGNLGGINVNGSQQNLGISFSNSATGALALWNIMSSANGSGFGAGTLTIANGSTPIISFTTSGISTPLIANNGATFAGLVGLVSPTSGNALQVVNNAQTQTYVAVGSNGVLSANYGLSLSGVANSYAAFIQASTTTGQSLGVDINAGTNSSDIAFNLYNAAGNKNYLSVRGDGLLFVNYGLSLTGTANSYAAFIQASTTSGQSLGIDMNAGTNSSDVALNLYNASGTTNYISVRGDGSVAFGGATQQGSGTVSVNTGLYVGGNPVYAGIPQNSQSGNYTTVLSDANKHIKMTTGGTTATIAANSSVAYPLGTAITFANRSGSNISIAINSDTLVNASNGATGTRTLANYGVATALKTDTTTWIISGSGLT